MFITNKEKLDIGNKFEHNKTQIEGLIKHVGKLQVDMGGASALSIRSMKTQIEQLQKMFFGAKSENKKLQNQITMLREINDLIIERVKSLETKQRLQVVIPKEKVQEMKDNGTWDNPEKRDQLLVTFVKEKIKLEDQKERKRAWAKKYYLKKKAKAAASKEAT